MGYTTGLSVRRRWLRVTPGLILIRVARWLRGYTVAGEHCCVWALGIERPIVQAPLAVVPRLAAAVLNAGALGMAATLFTEDHHRLAGQLVDQAVRAPGGNRTAPILTAGPAPSPTIASAAGPVVSKVSDPASGGAR